MLRRNCLLSVHRAFSSSSAVSLSRLSAQCRVRFQVSDAAASHVQIVPVLSPDEFQLRVSSATTPDLDARQVFSIKEDSAVNPEDSDDVKALLISKNQAFKALETTVQLLLPHTVDLNVAVANGSVQLQSKVEGDVKVVVGRGDIHVDKVRGQEVTLKTNGGTIKVDSLVEGETVRLEAADAIHCKKLMAGKAEIKLGKKNPTAESEFGAIYAATTSIASTVQSGQSKLRVGNVHGYLRVASQGLESVQVGSVTGSLDLEDTGDKCNVVAHFDSWTEDAASSILVGGNVHVSLQPAASIVVELHGTQVTVGEGCQFDNSEMDQLDEDYAVFTGELRAQKDAMASSGSSGKINLDHAKDHAMRTSFFMREDGDKDSSQESRSPRLFVHALSGGVSLDQLDWMANIKRKHLKQ